MENFAEPEKVYVEIDWYDGPRSGVADVNGIPHYFVSFFDEEDNVFSIFTIWPIREKIPVSARKAKAKFERINRAERYCTSGPDYLFRWHVM
ncbi:MAG: hypothetical protein WA154_14965 [Moraxellaceae bacterium]